MSQPIAFSHPDIAPEFPEFFRAYLEAALWSSTISDSDDIRDSDPFDRHFSIADFPPAALLRLQVVALAFFQRAAVWIDAEPEPRCSGSRWSKAGHDFWLTQNGHGAGFWDGDWPVYGDRLTKLSKTAGELSLYVVPSAGDEPEQVGVESARKEKPKNTF